MGISNNNTSVNAFDAANVNVYPAAYKGQETDPRLVPGMLIEGPYAISSVVAGGDVPFGSAVFPGGIASGTSVKGSAFGIAARTAKDTIKYERGEVINVATEGKFGAVCVDGCSKGGSVYSDDKGNLYGTSHGSAVGAASIVAITASSTVAGKTIKVRFEIDGKGYNYKTTTTANETATQIISALAAATVKDDDGETTTLPTGFALSPHNNELAMALGATGLGPTVKGSFDGDSASGVTATVTDIAGAGANAIQARWKWGSTASAGGVATLELN